MTTEYQDYFAARIDPANAYWNPLSGNQKFADLQQASKDKANELRLMASQREAAIKAQQAEPDSLVEMVGLDPEGVTGGAVNLAARGLAGFSKNIIGQIAAAPTALSAATYAGQFDDKFTEAYKRHVNKQATPEDTAYLNQKGTNSNPEDMTRLEAFGNYTQRSDNAQMIRKLFDINYLTYKGNTDKLDEQIGAGFDKPWEQMKSGWSALTKGQGTDAGLKDITVGFAELLYNGAEAAVDNPMATTEYVVENLPNLLLGASGKAGAALLGATNVGYAADTYQQGLDKYKADNNGAIPSTEVRMSMATHAASLALAEQLGEAITVAKMFPGKVAAKMAGKPAKDIAATSAETAKRVGFKKALLNSAIATSESTAVEAATEGYQTYAEGEILADPASAKDIYKSSVIGGLVGGGLVSATRTPQELLNVSHAPKIAPVDATEEFKTAVTSGNIKSLLDPKSKSYAPGQAVTALYEHSKQAGTSEEVKADNLTQANKIIVDLETRKSAIEASLTPVTSAAVVEMQTQVVDLKKQIADPANTDKVPAMQEMVGLLEEEIAAGITNKPASPALQKELVTLDQQLDEARKSKTLLTQLVTSKVSIDNQIAIINTPVAKDDTKAQATTHAAIASLIALSISTPERLDPKVAIQIANDTKNALQPQQRDYLRAFSDARLAANALESVESVGDMIANGSADGKHMGISTYRRNMAEAVQANNVVMADMDLADLRAFAADHQDKWAVAKEAAKRGKNTVVVKVKDGGWKIASVDDLSNPDLNRNGSFKTNSAEFINKIGTEAAALTATLKELEAVYELTFNQKPGVTDGKDVSKPTARVKASTQSTATPQAKGAGTTGTVPAVSGDGTTGTQSVKPAASNTEKAVSVVNTPKERVQKTEKSIQVAQAAAPIVEDHLTATPDEYEEAVRVSESNNEDDYDSIPDHIAKLVVALRDGVKINVISSRESKGTITTESKTAVGIVATEPKVVGNQISTEETQDTDGNQEVTEVAETGGLTNMAIKSEEGATYITANLLADNFTQRTEKESDTSVMPLVAIKNFYSSFKDNIAGVTAYLANKTMTDAQTAAVTSFFKHVGDWSATIRGNLKAQGNQDYKYTDMMGYLLVTHEDGMPDLDENVKVAIAHAAYSWAAGAVTSPRFLKDSAINALLGRGKDTRVGYVAKSKMRELGTSQNQLVESLGGVVLASLGLKAKPDASQEQAAKLQMALGSHVLKLLEDTNMVRRTSLSDLDMRNFREEGLSDTQIIAINKKLGVKPLTTDTQRTSAKRAMNVFFSLRRDGEGNLTPTVQNIFDAVKGTQGILNKIFQTESSISIPSLKPITTVQSTTAGTNQNVPSVLKKSILIAQSRPRRVDTVKLALLDTFSEAEQHAMIGVEEESNDLVHKVNRHTVEAKNAGLIRDYNNFLEYVGEYLATGPMGMATEFFLKYSPWKMQRVGIETRAVNPQTSKTVRFLINSPKWESKIKSDDAKLMNSFYLRVAEGISMKTERADNQVSIDLVMQAMTEPVYAKAIAALRKSIIDKAELTSEEKANVLAGVKAGGANLHTLDVLVGMAYQQNAETKAEGQVYEFTVNMMGEVDGVANGTMLNHVLLGAGSSLKALQSFMNMGGFFEKGSPFSQYNQYRGTEGNLDVYETTARRIYTAMTAWSSNSTENAGTANSIWAIAGDIFDKTKGTVTKDGRNLVKDALNPLGFGSSLENIVNGMSDAFLASVYKGIEKMSKQGDRVSQAEVNAYVANINNLISEKNQIPTDMTITQLMEYTIPSRAESDIKTTFSNTVGKQVIAVVEQDFAIFIERRDALTKTSQITFDLYNAVYTGMREAYLEELISAKEIPLNAKGERIGDMSKKHEAEFAKRIKNIAPVINTHMSNQDNDTDSGMFMGKSVKSVSTDTVYQNSTKFGKALKTGAASMMVRGYMNKLMSPGVAMMSATTHSTDSSIVNKTQEDLDILAIHDAAGSGVANLDETATAMNRNTWDSLLNYSPLGEVYLSLSRVMSGIDTMMTEETLSPQALANLQEWARNQARVMQSKPEMVFTTLLGNALAAANEANNMKYQFMAALASLDQYAYQGGNHIVTDANIKDAQKLLDAGPIVLSEQESAVLSRLSEFSKAKHKQTKITQVAQVEAEEETVNEAIDDSYDEMGMPPEMDDSWDLGDNYGTPTKPQFGGIGASIHGVKNDKTLIAALAAKPVMPAKEALKLAYASLATSVKDPVMRKFYQALITRMTPLLSPETRVHYVTQNTPEEILQNLPDVVGLAAWYDTGLDDVFVVGAEYKASLIDGETIVHELLHSILSHIISAEQEKQKGNPKYKSPALDMINNLESLRTAANEYAQNNLTEKEQQDFAPGLSDLHELLSYGLTNEAFQQKVLSKVQVKSSTLVNTIITGLKEFYDVITQMVFSGIPKEQIAGYSSGMAVLLESSAGLFDALQNNPKENKAKQLLLPMIPSSPLAKVNEYSTLDIYNALSDGGISKDFDNHLQTVLSTITSKLFGAFDSFKATLLEQQALSPTDVWVKALDTGIAPFASEALLSGFDINKQEAFGIEMIEATVRASLEDNEAQSKLTYRELSKLYDETYTRLKVSDFHTDPVKAQSLYDFIFKIETGTENSRLDYLARFAAMGLAHEGFNKMLKVATKIDDFGLDKDITITDRLYKLFENIVEFFHNKVTGTYKGQQADAKLKALVGLLIDVEAKKRFEIAQKANSKSIFDPLENGIKLAVEKMKATVLAVTDSNIVSKSSNKTVRALGSMTKSVVNDQVGLMMEGILNLRDIHHKDEYGLIAGTLNNLKGPLASFQTLLRASKKNEGDRMDVMTTSAKTVLGMFVNKGTKLSKEAKESITRVFIRTGAHNLVDYFSMAEIEKALTDKAVMSAAQAKLEDELTKFGKLKPYFIAQANALAYVVATGAARKGQIMLNAHNIATLHGTAYTKKITPADSKKAEPIIAALVSLYAMAYSEPSVMALAAKTLNAENARQDGSNGVEFAMKLHRHMEAESKDKLFGNNATLMIHGYTMDMINSATDIQTVNEEDGKELMNLGYKKKGRVGLDPADPDRETKHVYVMRDGGRTRRVSGAFSFTSKNSRGSEKHNGYLNPYTVDGLENVQQNAAIAQQRQAEIASMFVAGPREDLSKAKGNHMVPVLNESGKIVKWRYLMADITKDIYLERDNRFDKVLGTLAGSIYDKQSSRVQNEQIVMALKEQANIDYKNRPASYVSIGPKSPDTKMREIWDLLPQDTKEDTRKIWGSDEMLVSKDALDLLFGYRKLSLADMYHKDPATRNMIEKIIMHVLDFNLEVYGRIRHGLSRKEAKDYSKRAAIAITRSERAWQELVSETKDIIVVKSGLVMFGNIYSNMSLLYANGVPIKDIYHHHIIAWRGAKAYDIDSAKLMELEMTLATSSQVKVIADTQRQIKIVKDAIARNPVKELMDAGLMPTIVEDLNPEDDLYSYKSALARKFEKYTSKLPTSVIKTGKFLYMSHDSKLYQGLRDVTQLSDFVARYTLYQHLTNKKNSITKAEAIQKASDSFINYDIPMHRTLQYSDDMGFTMFTKYFLGIQRVLGTLFREHPGRVLSMIGLDQVMNMGALVLDGSALTRIGNIPFTEGAFRYPSTLGQLATVNSSVGLMNMLTPIGN